MQEHSVSSLPPPTEAECYQLLMENVVDYAIFTLDVHQHIVTWNAGAERILTYREAEIVGKPFAIIFLPQDQAQGVPNKEVRLAKAEGHANDERWHRRKDGSQFWAVGILTALYEANGDLRGFIKILRDMTKTKTAEEALQRSEAALLQSNQQMQEHLHCIHEQAAQLQCQKAALEESNARLATLAATDGLTGLKNHRTFQERLHEEMERAVRHQLPLSILLLDVDHFKSYNDTFGHPAGDDILQTVAHALQATARASDLVARYGGEEFAVILPETPAEEAKAAAERLRELIETTAWPQRPITVSVGVATLAMRVHESAFLVRQADVALYRSKERGRNCVTHSADPQRAVERRREGGIVAGKIPAKRRSNLIEAGAPS